MDKIKELKKKIIRKAIRKYGHIYPCIYRRSLYDCFTREGNSLYLWFNSEDMSTHIVQGKIGTDH